MILLDLAAEGRKGGREEFRHVNFGGGDHLQLLLLLLLEELTPPVLNLFALLINSRVSSSRTFFSMEFLCWKYLVKPCMVLCTWKH